MSGHVSSDYRGRLAPSPTGDLHLGSVATALFAAAAARQRGGVLVLRVEDLDTPRIVAGSEASQRSDLAWLGIRFDEGPERPGPAGPYRQSERHDLYEAAIAQLARGRHTYLCDCSRAEIARIASAPHEGEEGPPYPGTCRSLGMEARRFRRPPAVRLAVPADGGTSWVDVARGAHREESMGDFVLRRGDGTIAYQLATAVDDVLMSITEVVRGADLAASAGRQALIARLLGAPAPRYLHVPLLVGDDGGRLAKRAAGRTVAAERARGRAPAELLRSIAAAYGHPLEEGGSTKGKLESARNADVVGALAAIFSPLRFPPGPVSARLVNAES